MVCKRTAHDLTIFGGYGSAFTRESRSRKLRLGALVIAVASRLIATLCLQRRLLMPASAATGGLNYLGVHDHAKPVAN